MVSTRVLVMDFPLIYNEIHLFSTAIYIRNLSALADGEHHTNMLQKSQHRQFPRNFQNLHYSNAILS